MLSSIPTDKKRAREWALVMAERPTVAEVAELLQVREGRVLELLGQLRAVRRLAGKAVRRD